MSTNKRSFAFTALYATYFSDMLAWCIVLMLFAPLIIPVNSPLLPADTTLATRNYIMGLLTAAYPLAQFFASPLLGELSDRFGRKRVLLFSTFVSFISLILSAVAIAGKLIVVLFISRLLAGFAAGNLTLSQAGVADLTDENTRGRYMALFAIVGGLSWILGPYIGSILSDNNLVSWFNFSTPFVILAAAFLLCFLLVLFGYKETHVTNTKNKLMLGHAFINLFAVFKLKEVKAPFISFTLFYFGWFLFISFFSAFLIEKFGFNKTQIGNIFAYASVWFLVGGIYCNQWLLKRKPPESAAISSLIIITICIFASAFFPKASYFWIMLFFVGITQAIASTCLYTIHSKLVGPENQGKIFGSINAMFGFNFIITPPIASWLADRWIGLPDIIGGLALAIATIIYIGWYKKNIRK